MTTHGPHLVARWASQRETDSQDRSPPSNARDVERSNSAAATRLQAINSRRTHISIYLVDANALERHANAGKHGLKPRSRRANIKTTRAVYTSNGAAGGRSRRLDARERGQVVARKLRVSAGQLAESRSASGLLWKARDWRRKKGAFSIGHDIFGR